MQPHPFHRKWLIEYNNVNSNNNLHIFCIIMFFMLVMLNLKEIIIL